MNSTHELLSFKERLDSNYSSDQLSETLDDLIFKALRPIFFTTDHVQQTLVEMLPFVASNARRKFTNMPRGEFVDSLFTVITGHNKEANFKLLRKIRLERTVFFACIASFDNITADYETIIRYYFKTPVGDRATRFSLQQQMHHIENQLVADPNISLFSTRREVLFWNNQALDFKQMITEKFIRLAFLDSAKASAETGLNIDDDSLFKDYIVSISKAVNKFDSSKGTLTSFIRWWFLDAKTSSKGHEYAVAFSVPTAQRAKMLASGVVNFAQMIDEDTENNDGTNVNVLDNIISRETESLNGNIAIAADRHKMASLIHDIAYTFSEADKAALHATMQ
jgi:hypothetical protein